MSNNESSEDEKISKLQKALEEVPSELLIQALLQRSENADAQEDVEHIIPKPDQGRQLLSVQVETTSSRSFSGPVPPPEVLRDYNNVTPGLADRIVHMAESEQQHRHSLQSEALHGNISEVKRGQNYAFIICLVLIIGSILLILNGYPITGTVFAGVTIVALASLFINGRRRREPKKSKPVTNDPVKNSDNTTPPIDD